MNTLAYQPRTDLPIVSTVECVQEYLDRGLVQAMFGNLPQAMAFYRRAVDVEPDNAMGHYMLGLSLMMVNDIDEALAECRSALGTKQPGSRADWARWKAGTLLSAISTKDGNHANHD